MGPLIAEILSQIPLFDQLPREQIQALASTARAQALDRKQTLFLQGDSADCLFVLVSGCMQLSASGPGGQETVIKTVNPGEMFAEAVLFEREDYPVTAQALSDSMVYALPTAAFMRLLKDEAFFRCFAGALMRKLRYLVQRISYLSHFDVEDRLMFFFIQRCGNGSSFSPDLTKKETAAAIDATPETLSRLLARLKREGRLSWNDEGVRILDSDWHADYISRHREHGGRA